MMACTNTPNELFDVSDQPRICNGRVTTTDRLGISYSPQAVLSTSETPYTIACATMCARISNGVCLDSYGDVVKNYQTCLERLKPERCSGVALPVGYSGNTFYYIKRFVQDEYIPLEPC